MSSSRSDAVSTETLPGSSSDSVPGSPAPRKKVKRHVDSKYQHEWSTQYRMSPSSLSDTFVHRRICQIDFSVAGGGVHQVKRHCESKKHISNTKGATNQPTLREALSSHRKNEALKDHVICAELYFTRFVVEHNLPFAVADHFNKLCSVMFPDSKVAAEFSCGRTKTAALVTFVILQHIA